MSTADDDTIRPDRDEPGGVSMDELADLRAGLLTAQEGAALLARVDADPAAQALLADLDYTTALLNDLDPEPLPDDVAARINAALRKEMHLPTATTQSGPSPGQEQEDDQADDAPRGAHIVDLQATRERPRPAGERSRAMRRWQGPALLAAAAVVLGTVVVGAVVGDATSPSPQAGSAPVALTITTEAELEDQWPAIEGMMDFGFLSTPSLLQTCLSTAGLLGSPGEPELFGIRPIVFDGQYGMLVATPFEDAVVLTVLGPSCGNAVSQLEDIIATVTVPR